MWRRVIVEAILVAGAVLLVLVLPPLIEDGIKAASSTYARITTGHWGDLPTPHHHGDTP